MHCSFCGRKLRSKKFKNCSSCRAKLLAAQQAWAAANYERNREINRRATKKRYWKDVEKSREYGREKQARYRAENPERHKETARRWRQAHRDELMAKRREARQTDEFKAKASAYKKARYKSNLPTAISYMVRARMAKAFRSAGVPRAAPTSFGISYAEIAEHVGPRPENADLHHIVPVSNNDDWDFTDPVHVLAAFGPLNCEWRTTDEHKTLRELPTDQKLKQRLLRWARARCLDSRTRL